MRKPAAKSKISWQDTIDSLIDFKFYASAEAFFEERLDQNELVNQELAFKRGFVNYQIFRKQYNRFDEYPQNKRGWESKEHYQAKREFKKVKGRNIRSMEEAQAHLDTIKMSMQERDAHFDSLELKRRDSILQGRLGYSTKQNIEWITNRSLKVEDGL